MSRYIVIASDDNIRSIDLIGEDTENAHVVAFINNAKDKQDAIEQAEKIMSGVYENLIAYKIEG